MKLRAPRQMKFVIVGSELGGFYWHLYDKKGKVVSTYIGPPFKTRKRTKQVINNILANISDAFISVE